MADQYVFVGDLLGFSSLMLNLDDTARRARVAEWLTLIKSSVETSGIEQWRLVSDTVFAAAPGDTDGLRRIVALARHLLHHSVPASLPLRGAIAFGEVTWTDDIVYGPAIVRGYQLGESQRWMGVAAVPNMPDVASVWSFDGLMVYPVPTRLNPVLLRPTVAWDVPPTATLTKQFLDKGLAVDGSPLPWSFIDKVQNTTIFGRYLEAARRHITPDMFHGSLPTDLIFAAQQGPTS